VEGDESGLEDARGGRVPEPPHLPHDLRMRPGLLRVVLDLRTTTLHKCAAVPRRARI